VIDGDVVIREVVLAAQAEQVFEMFTDPGQLVRWIGIAADLEPRPGGLFRFEIVPGQFCEGQYVIIERPSRLVFTWGWADPGFGLPPGTSPLRPGSRVAFTARFLGRQLAYTYEITDFTPGQRLVMRTAQGPFPMETTYTWQAINDGSARMTLRNRGEPAGFPRLTAPLMAIAMRRATRKDLRNLKAILETAGR
jgi:uncharacterized protein YndB with AHSA1/START domain